MICPLPGLPCCVTAPGRVLGRIHSHYFVPQLVFSPIGVPGGVDPLIVHLQQAAQADEQRPEQLMRRVRGE